MRGHVVDAADPSTVLVHLRAALEGSGPAVGLAPGEADAVPDGTAVVIATSGSTGVPKRVVLGREALLASARATAGRIGEGRWLLALPVTSVAGLQVLTRSIVGGTQPVTVPTGPFDPAAFAAAMPAAAYTSLVPVQLARLLDAGVDLSGFVAILVGGQRLDPSLRERASAAGARIVRTYGSTETAGGCVYDGVPLDGVRLRIAAGEVQLGGPTLASGYLGDGPATDAAFPVDPDGTRWWRTGDLGELRDGVLAVTGRADDVYVSGGVNVSLARVQDAVRTVPGLEHAVVVAVPDERWGEASVVVSLTDDPSRLAAARAAVAEAVGRYARPARIVAVAAIPHLPNGKPDLLAVRRLATADR